MHTVERFIYTFKMSLQLILYALSQDKNEWVKHVSGIITKYNNIVHSTIEVKPVDAKLPKIIFGWHGIYKMHPKIIDHMKRYKKEIWLE